MGEKEPRKVTDPSLERGSLPQSLLISVAEMAERFRTENKFGMYLCSGHMSHYGCLVLGAWSTRSLRLGISGGRYSTSFP